MDCACVLHDWWVKAIGGAADSPVCMRMTSVAMAALSEILLLAYSNSFGRNSSRAVLSSGCWYDVNVGGYGWAEISGGCYAWQQSAVVTCCDS